MESDTSRYNQGDVAHVRLRLGGLMLVNGADAALCRRQLRHQVLLLAQPKA